MVKVTPSVAPSGTEHEYPDGSAISMSPNGALYVYRDANDEFPLAIYGPGEWRKGEAPRS